MENNEVTKYFQFYGSIVDDAQCIIIPNDDDISVECPVVQDIGDPLPIPEPDEFTQTVNCGQVANSALMDESTSLPRPFNLKVYNDPANPKKYINVIIDGITSDGVMFDNAFEGNGASLGAGNLKLVITDGQNNYVKPGESVKYTAFPGDNNLLFSVYLLGGKGKVSPGYFRALTECVVTYSDS